MSFLQRPTLKNLTKKNFGKPPKHQNPILSNLGTPHVSSFNYMVDKGLDQAVESLHPVEFLLPTEERISLRIIDATISPPEVPQGTIGVAESHIYPAECRQRAATYRGKLNVNVQWLVDGKRQGEFVKDLGDIPIMVKSNRCHLYLMSPKDLVKHQEHEQEWGGYFIVKGHERLVRMLLHTRRNYPVAVKRSGWKMRGALFSEYGISIRCVSEDQTSTTNILHYVTDGTVKLMFSYQKALYYVPLILILKCLSDSCDYNIYKRLSEGYEDDVYYTDCLEDMMQALHLENLHTHSQCKNYLGQMFRTKINECPPWFTNKQIADFLINECMLIHLKKHQDKFNMIAFMTRKLFEFARDKCKAESTDAVMMQEVTLGGHLYLQIIKDKLHMWLKTFRNNILKRASNASFSLNMKEMLLAAKYSGGVEASLENFFATGNLPSVSGLGLMQDTGLTIVAENINRMRYMSHFRAVHRGSFFQEMRTTEARQLLPDAWGFICPVNTPDGTPCGLLNHLTLDCTVTDVADPKKIAGIPGVLFKYGMDPLNDIFSVNMKENYVVQLDGCIIGYFPKSIANEMVYKLRELKIAGVVVPNTLEIVLVPLKDVPGQFPGLYLFTGPARMMRPVLNLAQNSIELIGTFEQVYMDICITPEEMYPGITTHMELSKTGFLSNLAQLIPMPDCNQSPRNMYQCQMGKQTMGTPCHNYNLQAETKLYRLQTPASPLFRPVHHDNIGLDDFAMGTNAIVAVISYTGYDMEDAMIINKASNERGFAHGSIYKSEFVELDRPTSYFCRDPSREDLTDKLDSDGLPSIGIKLKGGDPLYCFYSTDECKYILKKFTGKEDSVVDNVRICGNFSSRACKMACITYRISRNTSVGDKFASRAGQKGICSQKWHMEDLPFTETGLVPDIIFNPHGFPSRMTIAMMIELMAGKSAALHGFVHDATPFKFDEENTAIDYFGRLLEAGGYNYYGLETMYSGIDGREMEAQIFFGVVNYQRLRHMVSDKWQVRSMGPSDVLTRQPIKGRKRGGGVRFGEMERDGLISHGAAVLLQDRLLECSDKTIVPICMKCQSLLSPITLVKYVASKSNLNDYEETCKLCGTNEHIEDIQIPYILKFLVAELASYNIKIQLETKNM